MVSSSLPPPPAPPARPRRLADRYRLERCVAIGGMAEVWLAYDENLGRQVAVKLLHPNLAHDDVFVERLRREAKAVAKINHPGIVAVYDTVSDGGHEAVIMEYVAGRTLRQLLDDRGRLELDETVLLGASLADALNAAHAAGIVHRDVKPGNVLITPEGRVKLTDFGIATALLAADELTDDGVLLGTAKYVAPEQVRGYVVDGRADLYALAIVLYECLTGVVPFDGSDERAVALARLRQPAPPVSRLRPDVPPELDTLLATTLRPRPADRPATAGIFRDALQRVRLPASTRPPEPTGATTTVLATDGTRRLPVDTTPPDGLSHGETPAGEPADEPLGHEPMRTNQRAATWIVAILVLAALLASLLLWGLRGRGGSGAGAEETPTTTAAPETVVRPVTTPVATTLVPLRPGEAAIVGTAEFDPPPGNDKENANLLGFLTDHDADTAWRTVCYRQPTMAPKEGVGLIFRLSIPADGLQLVLRSPDAGWSASVFVADAVGRGLRDWGRPISTAADLGPGDVTFALSGNGRYVLVWFTQLGRASCGSLPYQLRVSEVLIERA